MSFRDRYILDERIGAGGMAEVFRGRCVGINDFSRGVAIKRMFGGHASSQFQEMFAAEARMTSQLVHPNIVSVVDFDRDHDGVLCLVMELVDGCDLARLSKTGVLPFEVVSYVIVEALKGLDHAHNFRRDQVKGIVHRDVSPHNLLLSWHGEVKVSDFGLAKARLGEVATATDGLKGKPAYMSPEQANSETLDGRSDLFAIGTIFWELLVGRPLFASDDTRASLAAILFGTVPPPRQLRADVPRDLERIVLKLLQRDRNNRYASAGKAIVDLLECESSRRASAARLAEVLADRFGRAVPTLRAPRHVATKRTRRPFALIGLMATIAIGSALLAWLYTRRPHREPTAKPLIVQEPYVALVEKRPETSNTLVPHFQFRLDLKELPPSCLLLLDWEARTVRDPTLRTFEHSQAVDTLVSDHDELAINVTKGASIQQLDSDCRTAMTDALKRAHALPPLPFIGAGSSKVHEPEPEPEYFDRWIERTQKGL